MKLPHFLCHASDPLLLQVEVIIVLLGPVLLFNSVLTVARPLQHLAPLLPIDGHNKGLEFQGPLSVLVVALSIEDTRLANALCVHKLGPSTARCCHLCVDRSH
eukprot:6492427-Amphidinium_carterae.3